MTNIAEILKVVRDLPVESSVLIVAQDNSHEKKGLNRLVKQFNTQNDQWVEASFTQRKLTLSNRHSVVLLTKSLTPDFASSLRTQAQEKRLFCPSLFFTTGNLRQVLEALQERRRLLLQPRRTSPLEHEGKLNLVNTSPTANDDSLESVHQNEHFKNGTINGNGVHVSTGVPDEEQEEKVLNNSTNRTSALEPSSNESKSNINFPTAQLSPLEMLDKAVSSVKEIPYLVMNVLETQQILETENKKFQGKLDKLEEIIANLRKEASSLQEEVNSKNIAIQALDAQNQSLTNKVRTLVEKQRNIENLLRS